MMVVSPRARGSVAERRAGSCCSCSGSHWSPQRAANRMAVEVSRRMRSRRSTGEDFSSCHVLKGHGRSRTACFAAESGMTTSSSAMTTEAGGRAKGRVVDIDTIPLPLTASEQVSQTERSLQSLESSGKRLAVVEWLLPVNQRKADFLAVDPTLAEPASTFEEFRVASTLASVLLEGPEEREVTSSRLDDGLDSEPVGLLRSDDNRYIAVVFPTADVVDDIRELAETNRDSTILLVNPQWTMQGNIISDFGFGERRRRAEAFLGQFQSIYSLAERRIGNNIGPNFVNGVRGVVRLLKTPKVDWQIHIMSNNIGLLRQPAVIRKAYPSYEDLRKLLIAWRRLEEERESLRASRAGGNVGEVAEDAAGAEAEQPTLYYFEAGEIESMDKRMLTAALMSHGVSVYNKGRDRDIEEMRGELLSLMGDRKALAKKGCRVCSGSGLVRCPLCVNKGKKYGRYQVDLSCSVCGGHQYVICPACNKIG